MLVPRELFPTRGEFAGPLGRKYIDFEDSWNFYFTDGAALGNLNCSLSYYRTCCYISENHFCISYARVVALPNFQHLEVWRFKLGFTIQDCSKVGGEIWKFGGLTFGLIFGKLEVRKSRNLGISELRISEVRRAGSLEIWECEELEVSKFGNL